MALMTAKEYIDSLRKLNTRVYMFGEKIDDWVDHPIIRPSINCVAMTYALAQDPQYADIMTATSNLTGRTVNRFAHLHQSADDLVKKVKMHASLRPEDRQLLPALRGNGRVQRSLLHHLRDRRGIRNQLPREFQEVPHLRAGQ